MDHFAVPEDELAAAATQRRLHRNFMGYTVKMGTDMLGVGTSSIGDIRGCFAQNVKKLSAYKQAIERGGFPIEKGYILNNDDLVRRAVITGLMCNFHLDTGEIEKRFGIDFSNYFARELEELAAPDGPVDHGFLSIHPDRLEVTGNGKLFVRNICMVFDSYLQDRLGGKPVFSRTV